MKDNNKLDNFLKNRLQNRAKGSESNPHQPQEIEISKLSDNPYQPRLKYNQKKLQQLAETIKENGLLQPISITKKDNGYIIIAGHRRKRAFEILNKKMIPVQIFEKITDKELKILATIENISRVNLSLLEEAKAYADIISSGTKIKELSQKIGKSQSDISRKRQILNLSDKILKDLRDNHSTKDILALTLLRKVSNEKKQIALYYEFLKNDRAWLKNKIDSLSNKKSPTPKCLTISKESISINSSELDEKKRDKILTFLKKELVGY